MIQCLPNGVTYIPAGISLRDYFKGQALAGMLSTFIGEYTTSVREIIASTAGRMADAMIEESKADTIPVPPAPLVTESKDNSDEWNKWHRFLNRMKALLSEQSDWSQETFGSDRERGPLGPLDHLKKEVEEAIKEPYDLKERADMLLLLLDINRRAGNDILELVECAYAKLQENKAREWPVYEPWTVTAEPCHRLYVGQSYEATGKKGIHTIVRYDVNEEKAIELVYQAIREHNITAVEHVR